MRTYSYNQELRFLETRALGSINIDDIKDHYEKIASDDSLPRKLRVLIDCMNVNMDIDNKEIGLTINSLIAVTRKYKIYKEAILVTKPYTTMIAMLFGHMSQNIENYYFKVFSTEEEAINWLRS
jgi:hypothetical protein